MYDDKHLLEGLDALGLQYTERQIEQLHRYYEMMVEKNRVMNLTGITEYSEVVTKHWLDSLCFAKILSAEASASNLTARFRVIDIGTGAGFPGIPMKIFYPEAEFLLLDSLNKRILFLQDVVEEIGLEHITCVHGRAEELARKDEYREKYDYCVSRAVARLASLSELCIPFVKTGGAFVSYKSLEADEEISEAEAAIQEMNAKKESVLTYDIPTTELPRKLVVIRKKGETKAKYPRGGGKPLKNPIVSK